MRLPRLRQPPPLCDCCRPATRLERVVWWLRARWLRWWWGPEKIAEFKVVQFPAVRESLPSLDDIVSAQPMTGPTKLDIEFRWQEKKR